MKKSESFSSKMAERSSSSRVMLEKTPSGNHFKGDTNQILFKTSSLALLKAKKHPKQLRTDSSYMEGAKRVMDFMCHLWKNGRLCDVTLTCSDDETLWAHKVTLGAHSTYLAKQFGDQPLGTICHINLNRFPAQILRDILGFIYTTDLELTKENIDAILECAFEMGLDLLVMACKDYLGICRVDTALAFLGTAKKFKLNDITTLLLAFISNNFSAVCQSPDYLGSDVALIRNIARDGMLGLSSELEIFLSIVTWIDFDRPSRLQYAPELIGYVRMLLIKPEVLVTHVESVTFIFSIPECHIQLHTAFKYHSLKLSGSNLAKSFPKQTPRSASIPPIESETGPRYRQQISLYLDGNTPQNNVREWTLPIGKRSSHKLVAPSEERNVKYSPVRDIEKSLVLVAVGGLDLQNFKAEVPGRSVFAFDNSVCRWQSLTEMSYYTHHHGVVSIGRSIYIIGGAVFNPKTPDHIGTTTSMVHAYDAITAQWRRLSDMKESRAYHAVTSYNGFIYAIGGEGENKRMLDSIEQYDVNADQWTFLTRLPTGPKIGLSAAICRGNMFVIGGYNKARPGNPVLNDVECFDILNKKWRPKNPLGQPRCHASLLTVKGSMYLIGGRTKVEGPTSTITSLSSVLVYDDVTDSWRKITNLRVARHDAGSAVIDSKIYIVGGMTTPSPYCLPSVECLDITTGQWEEKNINLPYNAAGLACCALDTEI